MKPDERKAWEERIRLARKREKGLRKYVSHPDRPHDFAVAMKELREEELFLSADAHMKRLEEAVEFAADKLEAHHPVNFTMPEGKCCEICNAYNILRRRADAAKGGKG
jgi:hypothetical protein